MNKQNILKQVFLQLFFHFIDNYSMLELLQIEKPSEMDGSSLFVNEEEFEIESPRLQDGKRMVRPPREGNVDAGTVV